MPAVYRYEHVVVDDEIDGQGHVGNLRYLKWALAAAVEHSAAQGWPSIRYHELGAGWVVRSHTIRYLSPALVDERIEVLTWVADFRRVRSRRKYKIVRPADNRVLATAATEWAFIDLADRRLRRIPPQLVESFVTVLEADEP